MSDDQTAAKQFMFAMANLPKPDLLFPNGKRAYTEAQILAWFQEMAAKFSQE
jgi:hypothetical protein